MPSTADLEKYRILASDSPIPMGRVEDVYFDDETWTIRFFLVETGTWLSERRVLIPVQSIREADWPERLLRASLTQQQVGDSPGLDGRNQLSRQHERDCLTHYGYPPYWERAGTTAVADPGVANRHLRSAREVVGYKIRAIDGDIGHLDALLVDDAGWVIRLLLIRVTHWGLGHQVEVAPEWIERVDRLNASMDVDFTREQVRDAPRHHPAVEPA
jgi:sporulation protein YlmC with PRC-barrel domain